ncbi:MAG: T9SS type A sorting domain-containing protein [Bacteroidia bacterium]|nr:T9SS type A sorting domain-containing protein [Bacteroidia bacterium]
MKHMKRYCLTLLVAIVTLATNAQQWEIDCSDIDGYLNWKAGIINENGEAVIIGECGPDANHYFPIVMRVTEDGEYDYRIFDTIGSNVRLTHVVQQENGNYFATAVVQPDDLGVGENVVFLVLDSELNIVSMKSYEQPEMVLGLRGGRLMLDDDGTVVFSCAYWYQSTYGQRTRPCFYRFDMNADTLSCSYVTGTSPDGYDCYQLLQKPDDDGFVVLGARLNNRCSLLIYDYDFNYVDGFILSPAFRQSFELAYSDHWISDNKLLIMGQMWPYEEYSKWNIGMAEVGLDGTFHRWDRVYHKQDTAIQSSPHCMAYVNDTTIYGGSWFYKVLGGESHASVCLYDTDMELLGRKEFIEPEYGDKSDCSFVLPMMDGSCLADISTYYLNSGYKNSKLIKMRREDFNPIPCSVSEVPKEQLRATAYPNPTRGELNIDISNLSQNTENRVSITDMQGITRMSRIIQGSGNLLTIDVTVLETGVYFYSVYNREKEIIKEKFIKN